tara:strand:+ start:58 stop:450 length:393 start_codon:yes stop_codon:yes gene_type:complete
MLNKIKEENIDNLRSFCVDLLSKTFMELGQRPNENDIVKLALILSEDLVRDFENLTKEDINEAFRNGVRRTDKFHLNVKTYYHWIKTHRDLIWQNTDKDESQIDKRLQYRSRQGTGMIELKQSKLLKQKQ